MKWKEQLAVQSSVSALYSSVPVGTCKCAWTNVNRETVCGIQEVASVSCHQAGSPHSGFPYSF